MHTRFTTTLNNKIVAFPPTYTEDTSFLYENKCFSFMRDMRLYYLRRVAIGFSSV